MRVSSWKKNGSCNEEANTAVVVEVDVEVEVDAEDVEDVAVKVAVVEAKVRNEHQALKAAPQSEVFADSTTIAVDRNVASTAPAVVSAPIPSNQRCPHASGKRVPGADLVRIAVAT